MSTLSTKSSNSLLYFSSRMFPDLFHLYLYMCSRTAKCGRARPPSAQGSTICVSILLYMSSYCHMYGCPRLLEVGHTVLTLYLRNRSDLQERYEPYCADFGPVNLGVVYRFCEMMHVRLTDPRLATRHLVYYTDESPAVCSNTAFLLAAYMVCCHGWTAEQAVVPFAMIEPNPFKPFRDATYLPSDFPVTLLDCLMSLKKSIDLGWYRHATFDVEDYEYWDHPLNGDLHQVVFLLSVVN